MSDLLSRTAKAVGETVVGAHTLGVAPRVQLVLLCTLTLITCLVCIAKVLEPLYLLLMITLKLISER